MQLMRYFLAFLLVLLLANTSVANQNSCFLNEVFVFGASLSAGYGRTQDAITRKGSSKTPAEILIDAHNPQGNYSNEYTKITGGWYYQDTEALFNNVDAIETMRNSSAIISMDAFYWDSIDGEASKNSSRTCENSIIQMENVITFARQNSIPLILSNIPAEKGTLATWHVRYFSGWREPFDNCYVDFNSRLEELCEPQNSCFVVDIYSVVSALNRKEKPGVSWNGQTFLREDLRISDGVHLSPLGNAFVADQILESVMGAKPELFDICGMQ